MPVPAIRQSCLPICVQCIVLSSVAIGLQQALKDHRKANETTQCICPRSSGLADREADHALSCRPQPPPLQKVTLKCPCGRRVSHTAVPVGQRPGILTCDAECERQKRSNRLANAFGIQDPAHHVPWVDRQPR